MPLSDALATTRTDLRGALRSLRMRPGFAILAMLTLALGIGASTALFGVMRAVVLRPLPYADGERLVHLRRPAAGLDGIDLRFAVPDVADFRARQRALAGMAEYHTMTFNLVNRGEPLRVRTGVVSADFFQVLGIRPLLGRTFRPGDDAPGAEPVMVVSHEFWRSRLGGDPRAVGRTVEMSGRAHAVVGVLPPLPAFPDEDEVFMPTPSCPFRSSPEVQTSRENRLVTLIGRLRPGVEVARAERELAALNASVAREHPEAYPPRLRHDLSLVRVRDELTRAARLPLLVVLATAGCVLLIACANVANLLAVRLVGRERELAVRAALGAGRGRLAGTVLAESLVLAAGGAVLGVLLAVGGIAAFGAVAPLRAAAGRITPLASEVRVDWAVLAFAVALTLLVGAGVGLVAFLTARASPAGALAARGVAAASPRRRRVQGGLVVAQVAATAALLVAAGLMLRTLDELHRVRPGFDAQQVLTMRLTPDGPRYATDAGRRQFHQQLVARVAAEPGVVAAAVAGTFPLNEEGSGVVSFDIQGRPSARVDGPAGKPHAEMRVVTPAYLRALGIPLVRGRTFTDADREGAEPVVMVNQAAARRYWGGADPVGTRITFDGTRWETVVGLVGDVRQNGLHQSAEEEVYRSLDQAPITGGMLVVRTTGDPLRMAARARAAVAALDPRVPVDRVRTLAAVRDASVAPWRLVATLLGGFAGLALLIAATGVGGALAFAVGQRTTEFGVRMALGATPAQVRRGVLRQGVTLAGVGLCAGLAVAAANAHVMADLLFGVTPADVPTYAAVALVLLGVTLAASYLPARRATRVPPAVVLRGD
jgi:predicted permease